MRSFIAKASLLAFTCALASAAMVGGCSSVDRPQPSKGGEETTGNVGLNLEVAPGIDINTVQFNRASNGEHVYSVDIVNLKTTYQFNRHFLIRLLEQYDSSNRRLLTDLLASYEFVPGTVFHAGYGSLYEKPDNAGNYMTVSRGLFFKASYLYRF